jgi:hypothetical protein
VVLEEPPAAATLSAPQPPSVSPVRALVVVGLILAGVFAGAYALRRRAPSAETAQHTELEERGSQK